MTYRLKYWSQKHLDQLYVLSTLLTTLMLQINYHSSIYYKVALLQVLGMLAFLPSLPWSNYSTVVAYFLQLGYSTYMSKMSNSKPATGRFTVPTFLCQKILSISTPTVSPIGEGCSDITPTEQELTSDYSFEGVIEIEECSPSKDIAQGCSAHS